MMGLAFIAAFIVYLLVSIGVVIFVVRWARKRGYQPVFSGILAGLVMYHLVFWDYLPTLIVYNHYVKTESGFWVYKTPEQWNEENPGVAATLTWSKTSSSQFERSDILRGYHLNERIDWVVKEEKVSILPVWREEYLLQDVKTNELLAQRTNIYSGYQGGKGFIRFWTINKKPFYKIKEFNEIKNDFKKIGREKK